MSRHDSFVWYFASTLTAPEKVTEPAEAPTSESAASPAHLTSERRASPRLPSSERHLSAGRGDVHTAWTHVMTGGDVQASMSAVKATSTERQPCIIQPVAEMRAFIDLVRQRLFDIGPVDGRTCRHAPERCSPPELPVAIAAST